MLFKQKFCNYKFKNNKILLKQKVFYQFPKFLWLWRTFCCLLCLTQNPFLNEKKNYYKRILPSNKKIQINIDFNFIYKKFSRIR